MTSSSLLLPTHTRVFGLVKKELIWESSREYGAAGVIELGGLRPEGRRNNGNSLCTRSNDETATAIYASPF